MWNKSLSSSEIEVGKQYQYEEKYYLAAEITILEKEEENTERGEYIKLKVSIDKIIFGSGVTLGEVFEPCGYLTGSLSSGPYSIWKIKPLGSMTDYFVTRNPE